ncbi:hypothetical protein [Sulfurimonas sp.]|uniref:hypothetical protein n=1 Tax=Sulfurimonas sp. TaxID=2022749 RepID=UPI0025E472CD|nr:hypothetical protein [Sulfurimonas sp.]
MHIINTLLIGKIYSVRRVEIDGFDDDGEYKNGMPRIEVAFLSESIDDNGDINPSMDKQHFDSTDYPKYKALENKVVDVPYILINDKKQKWELDSNMPIVELKDTFMNMVKTDKKAS